MARIKSTNGRDVDRGCSPEVVCCAGGVCDRRRGVLTGNHTKLCEEGRCVVEGGCVVFSTAGLCP